MQTQERKSKRNKPSYDSEVSSVSSIAEAVPRKTKRVKLNSDQQEISGFVIDILKKLKMNRTVRTFRSEAANMEANRELLKLGKSYYDSVENDENVGIPLETSVENSEDLVIEVKNVKSRQAFKDPLTESDLEELLKNVGIVPNQIEQRLEAAETTIGIFKDNIPLSVFDRLKKIEEAIDDIKVYISDK